MLGCSTDLRQCGLETTLTVLGMMVSENQVATEVLVDAIVPGGKRLRDEEIHLWNVNDAGKVIRFRHYVDTAKHIAAA